VFAGEHRCRRSLANRRGDALDRAGADVAGGKDTRQGGLQPSRTVAAGGDEAVGVEVDDAMEPIRVRTRADEYEQRVDVEDLSGRD
jgi:hypothetical protein